MSDLFDRVAAQALGLGMVIRARSRSRFEPGSEPLEMRPEEWEPLGAHAAPPAAAEVGADPVTPPALEPAVRVVGEDAVTLPALEPAVRVVGEDAVTLPAREPAVPAVQLSAKTGALARTIGEDPFRRSATEVLPAIEVAQAPGLQERDVAPAASAAQSTDGIEARAPADPRDALPMAQLSHRSVLQPSARRAAAAATVPVRHTVSSRQADDSLVPGPGDPGSHASNDAGQFFPAEHAVISPGEAPARAVEREARATKAGAANPSPRPLVRPSEPVAGAPSVAALPPQPPPPRPESVAEPPAPIKAVRPKPPDDANFPKSRTPGQSEEKRRVPRRQAGEVLARSKTAAPPAIEITIGRLEIRTEPVAPPRPAKPFQPHLDLAAYRARREGGR